VLPTRIASFLAMCVQYGYIDLTLLDIQHGLIDCKSGLITHVTPRNTIVISTLSKYATKYGILLNMGFLS